MSKNNPHPSLPGDARPTRIEATQDGGLVATVPRIHTVGVSNLCDIESHTITRIASSTSHFIRFFGGGDLQFAFTDKGELLQLSGHRIQFDISESGAVDVSPYRGT
jgi:hypothetical protein